MSTLNHFNEQGVVHMVDVGTKPVTKRTAVATGTITMQPQTLVLIQQGTAKKGDVLGTARLAAIMAAKKCSDLIPLCHPLPLTHVDVQLQEDSKLNAITAIVEVSTQGKTGVEMEALTATSVALLTIYDMCKAVDRGMVMSNIQLLQKSGGQSGDWSAAK